MAGQVVPFPGLRRAATEGRMQLAGAEADTRRGCCLAMALVYEAKLAGLLAGGLPTRPEDLERVAALVTRLAAMRRGTA